MDFQSNRNESPETGTPHPVHSTSASAAGSATRIRLVIGAALLIGLAERVGWALIRKNWATAGEATNVAIALAKGRGFADAFGAGQGSTAHLLPLPSLFAGGIYRLLGIQTPVAEVALLCWSLALTFATYALFAGVARLMGASFKSCAAGFCFLCIAPIFTTPETFDFRVWDGGVTMAVAALFLFLLLRAEAGEPLPRPAGPLLSALPALILFLQPMIGIAACLAWGQWVLRNWQGVKSLLVRALPFLLLLVLLFGSWTARNLAVMGQPIWLRDNLGLELAVANHPGAVAPPDQPDAFEARLRQIQPYNGASAFHAMKNAGGEVAYARKLGQETRAWMARHPQEVARIWMRHLREIVLPAPYQFRTKHGRALPVIRAILLDIITVAGLAGLLLLIAQPRRRRQALYLAPFVMLPILLYIPFQPIPRYLWLIYPPLTYLAFHAGALAMARLPTRRNASGFRRNS